MVRVAALWRHFPRFRSSRCLSGGTRGRSGHIGNWCNFVELASFDEAEDIAFEEVSLGAGGGDTGGVDAVLREEEGGGGAQH